MNLKAKRLILAISICLVAFIVSQACGEQTPPVPKTTPPRYSVSPVTPPPATPTPIRVGPNLCKNGDFEQVRPDYPSPLDWELVDGLTTFYEKSEGHGYVLRVDTSVPKEQARERWKQMIEFGINAPPPPPKGELKGIYNSIGAVDGVRHDSAKIPIKKGSPYYLKVDCMGKGGPKVFVKAFGNVVKKRNIRKPDGTVEEQTVVEERHLFEWFLACRLSSKDWETFKEWIPMPMPQSVDYAVIGIYSYWPNANYYWDNIEFYEGKYPEKPKTPTPAPSASPEPSARPSGFGDGRSVAP